MLQIYIKYFRYTNFGEIKCGKSLKNIGISPFLGANSYIIPFYFLRKVRDSNPRYHVMGTPHFECGSFDHSDNFPCASCQKRLQKYCFFLNRARKKCRFFVLCQQNHSFGWLNSQPQKS